MSAQTSLFPGADSRSFWESPRCSPSQLGGPKGARKRFPDLFLLVSPCRLLLCQHHLSLCSHLYALSQRLLKLLNALCFLTQRLLAWKKNSSENHKIYNYIQNGSPAAFKLFEFSRWNWWLCFHLLTCCGPSLALRPLPAGSLCFPGGFLPCSFICLEEHQQSEHEKTSMTSSAFLYHKAKL